MKEWEDVMVDVQDVITHVQAMWCEANSTNDPNAEVYKSWIDSLQLLYDSVVENDEARDMIEATLEYRKEENNEEGEECF